MTEGNLTDPVFAVAARTPHAVAVVEDGLTLSYALLCRSVCRAAARFAQAGWRAGDVVAIAVREGQAGHLIASLALARSGIVQVPLSPGDPPRLLQARIRRLGIKAAVSDVWQAGEFGIDVVAPERAWLDAAQGAADAEDPRVPGGDRLWLVAETSGTTAEPKANGISHDAEMAQNARQAPLFAHRPGERFVSLIGLRFSIGTKRAVNCICDGGTLMFAPAAAGGAQLLRWLNEQQIRYLACVPSHLHDLLREACGNHPVLPLLRILRASSAALAASALDQVRRQLCANLYVSYGLSEGGTLAAATPAMLDLNPLAVGRPLEGVELEIVDAMDRQVPPGAAGHLRVRGPGTGRPYAAQGLQASAGVFRDGWCYPGDIGFLDGNGLLCLKGRADDMMNFDGVLVGPGEIEAVLQQHPAVVEVAAFALPSQQHQDVPAVAIVSHQPLQTDELARYCRESLGVRAPRLFFRVVEIPKSPVGKVLRRKLTDFAMAELQKHVRPA